MGCYITRGFGAEGGLSGTISTYQTAPDVTDARSYECGDVDPDWEFARQLRLNIKCDLRYPYRSGCHV